MNKLSFSEHIWEHIEFLVGTLGIIAFTILGLVYFNRLEFIDDKFSAFMALLVGMGGVKYRQLWAQTKAATIQANTSTDTQPTTEGDTNGNA